MERLEAPPTRKPAGRIIGIGVLVLAAIALILVILVILQTDRYPRTDDASVRANFIQIGPEVSGRLVDLLVRNPCETAPITATTSTNIVSRYDELQAFAATLPVKQPTARVNSDPLYLK